MAIMASGIACGLVPIVRMTLTESRKINLVLRIKIRETGNEVGARCVKATFGGTTYTWAPSSKSGHFSFYFHYWCLWYNTHNVFLLLLLTDINN